MLDFETFLFYFWHPSCVCTIGMPLSVVYVYIMLGSTSVQILGTRNHQLRLISYGKSGFWDFQAQEFEPNGVCCHSDSLPNERLKSSRALGATNSATRAPNQYHTSLLQDPRDVPIA